MTALPVTLVCGGCGWQAPDDDPAPFVCRGARPGDDTDHVLLRVLDASRVRFPDEEAEANPFVAYRTLIRSYHLALAHGMSDEDYVGLVSDLDDAVARVDGAGFRRTPFTRFPALDKQLDLPAGVWVKDETGNVSGSHKGRHLMGVLIHLRVAERIGLGPAAATRPRLAVASCGNAALAAAVVAAAGELLLEVFVPEDADPVVLARLHALTASVTVCPREPGVAGDPTVVALDAAIAAGAVPFTCQGNRNGLAVEGGYTLGWEIASSLAAARVEPGAVFVQVGGGALASALARSLEEARALGALASAPALHTVQTEGAAPLRRALDNVLARGGLPQDSLAYAATHRSAFMWPWEHAPASIAAGILDDETYDWLAVTRAMVETGGAAHVVDEDLLREANDIAVQATGIDVDHTGSSGLAGLMAVRGSGALDPTRPIVVLFTGARRTTPPSA